MVRCFVNIDLAEKQKKKIRELITELEKLDTNIKFVEPENLHLTPRFLGNVSESELKEVEKGLGKAAEETIPFELKLKGTGVFPNRGYIKVIWIGVEETEELKSLKKRVDKYIEVGKRDNRKFIPHVTIGRMKSRKRKEEVLKILDEYQDIGFGKIKVDEITVKESILRGSKGPKYEILFEKKLKKDI
ncbi:MAG: RNA 2',3'-cyclic phosphodiesterase [Candidatus Undinarchaeales archaeon]